MNAESDFVSWALSPERTVEEAFGAELAVEFGLQAWKAKHKQSDPWDWEAQQAHRKQRRLNPAHRVKLTKADAQRAAEMLPELVQIQHWTSGADRDLRDLSWLRFCPKLRSLHLGPARLDSLEVLAVLPELEQLWLHDEVLEDYAGMARCPALRGVHLWPGFAWCDLRALAELPRLENLTFHGNLPMLEGVGPLSAVREILMSGWGKGRAPLRSAWQLPGMPMLRKMEVEPFARLDGMERYAAVRELRLSGSFRDLTPLAALAELRKLTIGGERYEEVRPLARLPRLRVLKFFREYPLDYSPLLEAPALREVTANNERIAGLELAGLNAALGGWDEEFCAPEPRAPGPLILRVRDLGKDPAPGFEERTGRRTVGVDEEALQEAEGQWLAARLTRELTKQLGEDDWGKVRESAFSSPRCDIDLRIVSIDAADRLPEVVEACRRVLAGLVNRWVITVSIDLRAQWENDPEDWKDEVQKELEERIARAHDFAERRREYLEYLERLEQYRLRAQQGQPPKPEEFAPPPKHADADDESEAEKEAGEVSNRWEPDVHPLWHDYYIRVRVTEEGLWTVPSFRGIVERLLGRVAEGPRTSQDDDMWADDGG